MRPAPDSRVQVWRCEVNDFTNPWTGEMSPNGERWVECEECDGYGDVMLDDVDEDGDEDGDGYTECPWCDGQGGMSYAVYGPPTRAELGLTSPGHGGAGQTAGSEGEVSPDGERVDDGRQGQVSKGAPSPRGAAIPPSTWLPPGAAPAEPPCERLPLVESPYERILLPAGGVRFRRTEEPVVKLLREVGREIDQMLEDEDPGYFERVRARLFGGGGT